MGLDDREVRERVARAEAAIDQIEAISDPAAWQAATQAVQALLGLYGEGLARLLARVRELGGEAAARALADDPLVAHLLLLHDLHPVDRRTRVLRALDEVRPYLRSHGGNVELLDVADGVARVRLQGSCQGCPSSAATLKLAIEEAVLRAAPDVERIEAEGVAPPAAPVGFVPLAALERGGPKSGGETGSWLVVGSLPQLNGGGMLRKAVAGRPVLFLKVDGDFYAYDPRCPGCGAELDRGELRGPAVACPGCGRSYDAHRAGRCLDDPELHLEPIPLLASEAGLVKVALASPAGER